MIAAGSSRLPLWAAWVFLVVCTIAGLYRYTLRTTLPEEVRTGPQGLEIVGIAEGPLLLCEVEGMRVHRGWHVRLALAGRSEGETVVLGLERVEGAGLHVPEERSVTVASGYHRSGLLTLILVGVTTLGLAAFLLYHRKRHPATIPLAATLAFLGTSVALEECGAPLGPGLWRWLPGLFWAYTYALVAPALLSFASAFYPESGFWSRLGWLKSAAWIFGTILGTCIATGIVLYVGAGSGIGFQLCLRCQYVLWIFLTATVLLVGTGFSVAYRRSTDWGTRNRIRWILFGTVMGGILPLALIILPRAFDLTPPVPEAMALLLLPLLPISLVISVMRHNLLDISVVVRQGLMYGPATVVVYLVFGGAFVFLGYLFLKSLVPDLPQLDPGIAAILAIPLLLFHLLYEPLRRRVQRIVNRLFFRSKYSYGRTVRAFSDELDRSLTGVAILNFLRSQILQTVMPTWVQVVDMEDRWTGYCDNVESADLIEEPLLRLPFHDLDGLELWLGPKRSGMAYHTYDRALLETLIGLASTGLHREVLQRRLLAEAAEKERLEALAQLKDDFLSLVSHDLRSPLSAITLRASLMARRSEDAGDEKGCTDALGIERNALRLGHMVERLLHAARVEAGRVEPQLESCRLADVASDVIERHKLMADATGVTLENAVLEEAVALADPLLLQEVLSNLVDNALKVSEEDTSISIGAERMWKGWELTVSDQGPGIPQDRVPTLFERGEVTGTMERTAGFGLGLFLVRKLVELQGGNVQLRETSPEGTTFAIQLPE
ncbi:MAG: hypothetical protein KAT18_07930 [Candidatus Latescibacteria bacterium]|nr:hypothetical protein [Candidatus Latescibacterota bacterium]